MVRVVKKFSIWYNALWLPSHYGAVMNIPPPWIFICLVIKTFSRPLFEYFFVCLIGTYILMLFTGASYEFVIKFNVYFIASWFP